MCTCAVRNCLECRVRKNSGHGTPQRSASISSGKNGKTDPVQALIAGAQPSSKVAKLDVSGTGKHGTCVMFSILPDSFSL